ncbi:hypothetical protein [Streptodolium elevatio]
MSASDAGAVSAAIVRQRWLHLPVEQYPGAQTPLPHRIGEGTGEGGQAVVKRGSAASGIQSLGQEPVVDRRPKSSRRMLVLVEYSATGFDLRVRLIG